jgi:fructose-1,6-bisphosphatase I
MRPAPITLDRFILEEQRSSPGSTGELSLLLMRLGVAAKRIASALARAGLTDAHGTVGSANVHGEEQKKLDVVANDILLETFDYGGLVSLAASEEMEEPVVYGGDLAAAHYAVLFDPMDGSSNIDVNGTLGTIFSIRRRRDGTLADLLRAGHEQVAAGYFLFGPSVLLVYTCGDGVHLFTLDPSIGEFLLTRRDVRMPERGRAYAVNEGRAHAWPAGIRAFVDHLKQPDAPTGRPYATRYSASLVADVHRILLEGGIYLYPATAAQHGKGAGKLRVLYECHPLAFVVERAGGKASTGSERVLDVVPESLHERMPLAIGSRVEVELFDTFAARP